MSNNEQNKSGGSGKGGDTEEALKKELEKESAEGKNSVGDVKSNRNLTGASSWDTLPDDKADSGKKSS